MRLRPPPLRMEIPDTYRHRSSRLTQLLGAARQRAASARDTRAGTWARALLSRPPIVVSAIVALSCAWIASHSVAITEWIVMTDELQHIKLAVSVLSEPTLEPTVRGRGVGAYSHLYPLLISPFWALFDVPTAWRLTHVANALFFASAAIPAYLLTRQVVASRLAGYVTAFAATAVPWAGLSALVMTEPAAYPAFLWAVLAIHIAIVRPSPKHDLLALGGVLLAFLGRTQFAILAGILPLALLLHEFGYGLASTGTSRRLARLKAAARRVWEGHRVLAAVYALALLTVLLVGVRRVVDEALGNYGGTTTEGDLLPPGFWETAPSQLQLVVVGAAALPFLLAASWAIGSAFRPTDKPGHAYAVMLLLIVPLLTWEVTTFGLRHAPGPIDRYLFYLAPLLFVGTTAFLLDRARRPLALLAGGALYVWLILTADAQFTHVRGPYMATPASAFHAVIGGQAWALGNRLGFDDLTGTQALAAVVPLAAFALALLAWFKSRTAAALAAAVLVVGFLVLETEYVMGKMEASQNSGQGRITSKPLDERDWVDDAVPDGASAAIVPHYGHDTWTAMRTWWSVEAFNKTVEDSYVVTGGGDWTPFPDTTMSADASGRITFDPQPEEPADYLVYPVEELVPFRPAGKVAAAYRSDIPEDRGFELLEVDKPYRAAWLTEGFGSDGWLGSDSVGRVRVFPPDEARPQRIRVTMKLEMPAAPPRPSRFAIEAEGRARTGGLGAHAVVSESARVCVGSAAPAEVLFRARRGIELPDGRDVLFRLTDVDTDPVPGPCTPDVR